MFRNQIIPLLVALSLLAACGSDPDTDPGGSGSGASDVSTDGVGFDVNLNNDGAAVDSGPIDGASVDVAPDPCGFPKEPISGEPGAKCAGPDDCDSGFCIDTAEGKRCTKTCTDCCPGGWKCEQAPGQDTVFVCLPKMGALCLPCTDDAACEKLASGALCIPYNSDGGTTSFCAGACAADKDCPAGYGCKEASGSKGKSKQCVKSSGMCGCSDKAVEVGYESACTVINTSGVCSGVRQCSVAGLSGCSAAKPAAETCNGNDDDCDGQTDEDLPAGPCEISNAFGACKGTKTCTEGKDTCDALTPVAEACDGKDNDCDGQTDEGCDDDGDGFCAAGITIVGLPAGCTADIAACNKSGALPAWCPKGVGDCDDSAKSGKAINPGQKETCGNQLDDDCDGNTDTPGTEDPIGCKQHYPDVDGDGFGAVKGTCLCGPSKAFPVTDNSDCKDDDKLVNPKAKEICANGKDDDCNNSQNDVDAKDCVTFYLDGDGDKFGTGKGKCLCAPLESFKAKKGGDCDDKKTAINPGVKEACNTIDDNCNGATDEADAVGCKTWYADKDKDTYGSTKVSACLCDAEAPYTTLKGGDCNDDVYAMSPGFKEICYDSMDNDCNGDTDEEDGKGCVDYYMDADGDGYGDKKIGKRCLCDKGDVKGFIATKGGDCNDDPTTGKTTFPNATEVCDGKDNDCDGKTDTGCNNDGDGYCAAGKTVIGKPKICPNGGGDCNDDPNKGGKYDYPGAKEICDGKDNNCKNGVDEGCDDDGDGWCDKNMTVVGSPAVCPKGKYDCADKDKSRNPGAKEICDNKDNNCKSGVDEGCDNDNDGWCDANMVVVGKPSTCLKGGGDCCDTDYKAKPQATGWYSVKNKCGSWDYNCSKSFEKRWTVKAAPKHICKGFLCSDKAECVADPSGWQSSAPSCGTSSTWISDYKWDGSLDYPLVKTCKTSVTSQRTQMCR
ncbi:MAG: putative metal-binding motif-containing protein [Myxococcales bacterium]|nr:putative metal-binding motif-containing protein [Myxococcales bacterium]